MPVSPEELELLDALKQVPLTPAARPPADADVDEILDFFRRPREVDLFAQLGDCSLPLIRPERRYVAINVPGEYIRTLDHVYGPGKGLQELAERFRLDPIAHIDATRCTGDVVLFLAEADAKRLGDTVFASKAVRALSEVVKAIPAEDAERSITGMSEEVRLSL